MMDQYANRWIEFALLFFVFLVILVAKLNPFSLYPIGSGLDPSWVSALSEASAKSWRFGHEIVFTGGPLSALYTRAFQSDISYFVVFLSVVLVLYISACLSKIAVGVKDWRVAFLSVAALCFTPLSYDAAFFAVPLLMAALALAQPTQSHWLATATGIFLATQLALAKFSVFPILALVSISLDLVALYNRRLPWMTLFAATLTAVGFVIAGQDISDLSGFLISSFQVASGYSEAMSTTAHHIQYFEVAGWLICAMCLLLVVAKGSHNRRYSVSLLVAMVSLVVLAGFLYVAFKAGFVRHDLHSLIAWGSLAIAAQVFLTMTYTSFSSPAMRALILTGIVGSALPGYLVSQRASGTFSLPFAPILASATHQLNLATQLALTPRDWLKVSEDAQALSMEAIRQAHPLPALVGTVDIIPSEQAVVIANGLSYHPRPTIQEYTAYTAALIGRDRDFFSGERAPDNLIMAPGSIDNRHPASAEGSLWPLFLERYMPAQLLSEMAVLKRREKPLEGLRKPSVVLDARIGEDVSVPLGTEPLMIAADIRPTTIGQFLNFAFKPPQIKLVADYDDGTKASYRLIPAMAREGFLISPLVTSAQEYVLLASGRMDYRMWKRPTSIRIEGDKFGIAYHGDIGLTFTQLQSSLLTAAATDTRLLAQAETEAGRGASLAAIISSSPNPGPDVKLIPEGLSAHAPSSLAIPVHSAKDLEIGFGIRAGAWQNGGDTDGVCFRIKTNETTLFERCLDPKHVEADRGRQSASVAASEKTQLILETSCGRTCSWDWSYWDFEFAELP